MKSAILLSVTVIGLVVATLSATPVHADNTESSPAQITQAEAGKDKQAKKEKKTKKKKEKRECRRMRETGSRIATRVCKKPSQWARDEENSRETVERSNEGSRRNTTTGD